MKKILILSVLLTGCSTTYQPHSLIGQNGFAETELSQNHYKVTFKGNEKTSQKQANDFAMLRASELMIAKGCLNFKVLNSSNEMISSVVFPQTNAINPFSSAIENRIHGNTNTFGQYHEPKSTVEVSCSAASGNQQSEVYVSAAINQEIKKKYDIDIQ